MLCEVMLSLFWSDNWGECATLTMVIPRWRIDIGSDNLIEQCFTRIRVYKSLLPLIVKLFVLFGYVQSFASL